MIGKSLSHYRIVDKLGEGGMGVVYKAHDTHLDRFVAIKVLPAEKVADPDRKRRFVQEAKSASALNHPNIIHVYDIDQADGADFIAMEYVAGKTLEALIPRSGMRINQALKIAIQIADGLGKAHGAGIIHRDLKPANVIVSDDGLVKILDFGLAKLFDRPVGGSDDSAQTTSAATTTLEGALAGTIAYMSPEQAEGKDIDPRSDIFSLGSVLYEMVTGRRAFQGDSPASTLASVIKQEPKPPGELTPDVPRNLERVIQRCLRKDPARRWQHVEDMKVELEELKQESDSQVESPGASAAKRSRRRLLAALLVLPLLVTAGWLTIRYAGRQLPPTNLVQLTAYPGSESSPSYSPDGQQIAFSWDGEKENNQDIYIKIVGETGERRLTTDPAPDVWPAWSPDGRRIAFQRSGPGLPAIWWVSPLGGAEQKLADGPAFGPMSWSPNGKWLAVGRGTSANDVGDVRGIFLVPGNGGEPVRVSNPKAPGFDYSPSFSRDGRLLAYASCVNRWSCDVFVQPLGSGYAPQGVPRRITRQGLFIQGLAWSRDGGSLIFGGSRSWMMNLRLWRVESSGRRQPELMDLAGFHATSPSVAPAGDRLAFSQGTSNLDVWRYPLGGVPSPLLTSSLADYSPRYSPDGSRIAFSSGRSGDQIEIWITASDGSHPVRLTNGPGRGQGTPRWSPDGRLIAFDSLGEDGLSHIYVIDANGGGPRPVTSGTSSDHMPCWSRDGRWIYFYSNRSGRNEIWRIPFGEGGAQQVTDNGGEAAFESVDGKTLFYAKNYDGSPLLDGSNIR